MEAFACLCKHPNVIKFLAIFTKTMEAYTFVVEWENFLKNVGLHTKYSPIIDNHPLL
jgi:hypothetical protein